ncbi:hypothetical protein GC170_22495 [bacterium]|nr:hypothetical protein [bacterium]
MAPLRIRLELLRKLHAIDPTNIGWADDLRLFERKRLAEIEKEASAAENAGELSKLERLANEIQESEWTESPPDALVASIRTSLKGIRLKRHREATRELLNKADAAFREKDKEAAREPLELIATNLAKDPKALDDSKLRIYHEIRNWLEALEAAAEADRLYRDQLILLDRGLDDRIGIRKLEPIYESIRRMERPISEQLEKRYLRYRAESSESDSRKFKLRIGAALIALFSIAGALGTVSMTNSWKRRVNEAELAIGQLLASENVDGAEKEIERLETESPWIAHDPIIAARKTEVAKARAEEERRKETFEMTFAGFNAAFDQRNKTGALNDVDALDFVRKLLNDAKLLMDGNLAKLDDERTRLSTLMTELTEIESKLQIKANEAFLEEIAPVEQALRELNPAIANEDALDKIRRMLQKLDALLRNAEQVEAPVKQGAGPLKVKLEQARDSMIERIKANREFGEIVKTVGDSKKFRAALQAYVNRNQGKADAIAIQGMIDRQGGFWEPLEAMTAMQRKFASLDVANLSKLKGNDANALHSVWGQLKTALPWHPSFSDLNGKPLEDPWIERMVRAIAVRSEANNDQSPTERIVGKEGLGHPAFIDTAYLAVMPLDKNNVEFMAYYLVKKPQQNQVNQAAIQGIRYEDLQLSKTVQTKVLNNQIAFGKFDNFESPVRKIATPLRRNGLRVAIGFEWESRALEFISQVRDDDKIDALAKYYLLRQIVQAAVDGSPILATVLKDYRVKLLEAGVANPLNFVDPHSTDARNAFGRIRNFRLFNNADFVASLQKELKDLPRPDTGSIFYPAAVVNPNLDGLIPIAGDSSIGDGDLHYLDTSGPRPQFVPIGKKQGAQLDFEKKILEKRVPMEILWVGVRK